MDPYAAYPQAVGPPVRAPVVRVKGKMPIVPILGALALVGAAVFAYLRFFRKAATQGTATVTAAHNDTISQATNGNPGVSAAAGGAVLAAPVPSATSVLVETPSQAVAAAAVAAAIAPATSASTPTSSSGGALSSYKNTTTLGPAVSGLCMSEGGPNGAVALYWCYGGTPQKWAFDSSQGTLTGNSSGDCATATGTTSGSSVISKPCSPGTAGQMWNWLGNGFQLQGTTNCMDSTTLSNGATMSLTPCSGAASQTYTQS